MKIRFRRKSQGEWLVLFILMMPFAFFLLLGVLQAPSMCKYLVDIGWCALLFILLWRKGSYPCVYTKRLAILMGVFFFLTLLGQFVHYQSIAYYLWGIRNNARFFVFFFGCVFYLKERTADSVLRLFDKVFWINFVVMLYQFFVLGYNQDYLGGIFGVEKGCNAYTNILLVIITVKSLLLYMDNKTKTLRTMIELAVCLVIAALSELKAYFIELVVIIIMSMILTRFSARKVWIILCAFLGMMLAIQVIGILFPIFKGWFTWENILSTAISEKGYTGNNDLNRLTAIPVVLELFLPTGLDKLFGLGLGNCDHASYDFLTTPFYTENAELNYIWFSSAYLVLETGIVGFALYCTFFVMVFFYARKKKMTRQGNVFYCQFAQIMAVMCGMFIIYNVSMRTEAGFMAYFILALPFIQRDMAINVSSSIRRITNRPK